MSNKIISFFNFLKSRKGVNMNSKKTISKPITKKATVLVPVKKSIIKTVIESIKKPAQVKITNTIIEPVRLPQPFTKIENVVTSYDIQKNLAYPHCPRCHGNNMATIKVGEYMCHDCGAGLSI